MPVTLRRVDIPVGATNRPAALWLPPDYDARPDHRWPAIVFLHGMGERGDDGVAHTRLGFGPAMDTHPERFAECVVLMPQCAAGDVLWAIADAAWMAGGYRGAEDVLDATHAWLVANLRVDLDRLALTGMSMGGYGTFVHAARRPDRYRALVAVCGGGRIADAAVLAQQNLWVLHGDADDVVGVDESRRMVDAIRAAGGEPRYTEFAGVGHDSWDAAYADPDVIAFLLA